MALFDRFRLARAAAAAITPSSPAYAIASPLSDGQLTRIVWSDVFGTTPNLIGRADALTIPGVFKARAVLLSLLAGAPLVAFNAAELEAAEDEGRDPVPLPRDEQPAWLTRTSGAVSPWHRMALTLDDHIFYGWSLWARLNDDDGNVVDVERIPKERWKFDDTMRVLVDRAGDGNFGSVDESEIVLIPGASEGLLAYATRSLNGAIALEEAWVERAKNPVAMTELHQTQESNLKPEEAKQTVDDWNAARRAGGGAAFTPWDIEARDHGQVAADLYVEGRNGSRIDVANFFNMPTSLLDGSVSTASLTYSTQEGDANEVLIYTVPYWRDPIVGRLSLDDVAGEDIVIRQNLAGLTRLPQSPIGDPGHE